MLAKCLNRITDGKSNIFIPICLHVDLQSASSVNSSNAKPLLQLVFKELKQEDKFFPSMPLFSHTDCLFV
jgi:hypothetical protein